MPRMTHLIRRGGGLYWFRFRLPKDVREAAVPEGWPVALSALVSPRNPARFKSELTHSLRTTEGRKAKGLAAKAIAHAEQLCDAARLALRMVRDGAIVQELSPEDSAALANKYHASILTLDEVIRKDGFETERALATGPHAPEPGMSGLDLDVYAEHLAAREGEVRRGLATTRPPSRTKRAASAILKAASVSLPGGTPERHDTDLDFLAAERRALRDIRARLDGEIVPTPAISNQASGPPISKAFEDWSKGSPARGAKKPGAAVVAEGRVILRHFIELHGDLPVAAITKRHARELLSAEERIPKGLPSELRKLSVKALLARNLNAYAPRAAATVNKSVQIMGGVLRRAERDGHVDHLAHWSNPFHKIAVETNPQDAEPYEAFDTQELNRLFASPVFAQGERPQGGKGDAAFWFPVLGLLTGARRGELAQLRAGDIKQDADTDVWFVDFHTAADGNRLKTAASRRKTPLHPVLAGMGLVDYAQGRLKAHGPNASLLPCFAAPVEPKTKAWTKWFSRYLARHVVDHPSKSFHSFRGTFKRFARAAGCEEHVIDALVGHAANSVGRGYGRQRDASTGALDKGFPLEHLAAEIAKVRFAGVKWPN